MTLTELPNIGKVIVEKLRAIEINTPDELRELGSEKAIIRIAALEHSGACINMLYAIEGAIQEIRWHGLSTEKKDELKEFYSMLKKET